MHKQDFIQAICPSCPPLNSTKVMIIEDYTNLHNAQSHATCNPLSQLLVHLCYQWRIHLWADRAAAPPIDPNLGLVMAAPNSLPQTRGQIFI